MTGMTERPGQDTEQQPGQDEGQDRERQDAYVDSERPADDLGGLDPDVDQEAAVDHPGLTSAASGGSDEDREVGLAGTQDDPQTHPAADQKLEEDLVRENAETSLDQPSESVE